MSNLSELEKKEKIELYKKFRLSDQISWYNKNAKNNQKK